MPISSGETGVSHQSSQYRYMLEDWLLIDAVRGGTRTMRMAGATYMPKRTAETVDDYNIRLQNATMHPAFIETSRSLTGRVFAQPMSFNEDVPAWIKDEVLTDCDLAGRKAHVFFREVFQEALEFGMSHVLVESPVADGAAVQTMAQQKQNNIRPYYVRIHPRNVLGWRESEGTLTQLRVQFSEVVNDGDWATLAVDRIRVYDLIDGKVRVQIWEQFNDPDLGTQPQPDQVKSKWKTVDEIWLDIDTIPFVTFYTMRTGYMMAVPPMRELAFLNAKHWRLESEMDALLETAMVPILCTIGVTNTNRMTVGARQFVKLPNGGDMKYVEHHGNAITSGEDKLKEVQEQMRQAGAALLKPITGARTGRNMSEVRDEIARDNSQLGDMVLQFADSVAILLNLTAKWRKEDKGGTVLLHPNLDPEANPGATIDSFDKLRQGGVLSRQTIFEEIQGIGILRETRTWDDEVKRIEADTLVLANTAGQPLSPIQVQPGAKPTDPPTPAPAPAPAGAGA